MNRRIGIRIMILAAGFGSAASVSADGLWAPDGMPVANTTAAQYAGAVVSDGGGGAILAWIDSRSGANKDIYAQRVNDRGAMQWNPLGVPVAITPSYVYPLLSVMDGAGGAILAWADQRSGVYDVFAQRLDAGGTSHWTANGRPLCTGAQERSYPVIAGDGAGGTFVAWVDSRSGSGYYDLYGQHLDANGNTLWAEAGGPICTSHFGPPWLYPNEAVADGAGGLFVAWWDNRIGTGSDIYAQHLDAAGNAHWVLNGAPVCLAPFGQYNPVVAPDGAGGIIVAWTDQRALGGANDLYAQRLDSGGNSLWTVDGVPVATGPGSRTGVQIAVPGNGTYIVLFQDDRTGNQDLYAQAFNGAGAPLWPANGAVICGAPNDQVQIQIAPDFSGDLFLCWQDARLGNKDIFAQRMTPGGVLRWGSGIPLTSLPQDQAGPLMTAAAGGGAITAWSDTRYSSSPMVFCQKIIRPLPRLAAAAPPLAPRGQAVSLSLTGQFFSDDKGQVTYVKLTRTGQPDIPASGLSVASDMALTCSVDLTGAALGNWWLVAVDSLGQTSTPAFPFAVTPPMISSLAWISAPAANLFTSTANNLLGQINCSGNGFDTLTSLAVENIGTATSADFSALHLWYWDTGRSSGVTFNPGVAQNLGAFSPTANNRRWTLALNQPVLDGSALYVSADVAGGAQIGATAQLALFPGQAVFALGATLPAAAILSASQQTIARGASIVLDILPSATVNVIPGQAGVPLGQIQISNVSGAFFNIHSLRLALLDQSGQAAKFEQAFSRLTLNHQGTAAATLAAPYTGDLLFAFPSSLSLPSQTRIDLDLIGDLLGQPVVTKFQCGPRDAQCVDAGALAADPATGKSFPLLMPAVSIRQPDLSSTFGSYPNPFRPSLGSARITYYLPEAGTVNLTISDLSGRPVVTLVSAAQSPDLYTVPWDGHNQAGYAAKSGVYVLRIDVRFNSGRREILTRKIAVVR